eukprot:5925290-Pleurochrysis_carterae.AAC.1
MVHSASQIAAATKGFYKNDNRAVAAAAPSRFIEKAGGAQPSGGAPYELPNGQWCSKGTSHFNHDK